MDELFGELREMLQSEGLVGQIELIELLRQGYDADPDLYEVYWKPYLACFELPEFQVDWVSGAIYFDKTNKQLQPSELPLLLPENGKLRVDIFYGSTWFPSGDKSTLLDPIFSCPTVLFGTYLNFSEIEFGANNIAILEQSPILERVVRLGFNYCNFDSVAFAPLSVVVPNVVDVTLVDCYLEEHHYCALADEVVFPNLVELRLAADELAFRDIGLWLESDLDDLTRLEFHCFESSDDYVLVDYFSSSKSSQLKYLALEVLDLSEQVWTTLSQATHIKGLEYLELVGREDTNVEVVAALLNSPITDGLKHLCMTGFDRPHLDAMKMAKCFVGNQNLSELRRLNLCWEFDNTEVEKLLLTCSFWSNLEFLKFTNPNFSKETLLSLVRRLNPNVLSHFEIVPSYIDDEIIQVFADWVSAPHLTTISISGHYFKLVDGEGITDVGAKALANSRAMASLRCLELDAHPIGDEGVVAIAQSPYLRNLERLGLTVKGITVVGRRALEKAEFFPNLMHLHCEPMYVDEECADEWNDEFGIWRSPAVLRDAPDGWFD